MKTARETLEQIFDFGLVTESEELIEQYAKQQAVEFAKHSINESYISEQREREWQEWYDEFRNQK